MPRKGISYEQVARACNDLQKTERLSVRAIQARTGGSMTTVLKHYRRWQRERSGQQDTPAISERLRNALLSELEDAAARSRQAMQQQLQKAQQRAAAWQAEAEQKQRLLAQQRKRANQRQSQRVRQIRDTEQRAAAAEGRLRTVQARLNAQETALSREQHLRRSSEKALHQM